MVVVRRLVKLVTSPIPPQDCVKLVVQDFLIVSTVPRQDARFAPQTTSSSQVVVFLHARLTTTQHYNSAFSVMLLAKHVQTPPFVSVVFHLMFFQVADVSSNVQLVS